jgi:CitMHS family citrate-Mg2+:H+ or citrate-Ca2+:H+ symporter
VDVGEIFVPMILQMFVTAGWVLFVAYVLGKRERKRIGMLRMDAPQAANDSVLNPALAEMEVAGRKDGTTGQWIPQASAAGAHAAGMAATGGFVERRAAAPAAHAAAVASTGGSEGGISASNPATARPKLIWVNFALTAILMGLLIKGALPLPALFMIFFAIAIMVNYPKLEDQKERIAEHAANVVPVVSLIFAAGIFVGILQGTKMVDAIATSVIAAVPAWMGPYMAIVTGVLSIPFTFFISNDAFYFGIVPILAKAAAVYGISAAEIGRASIIGQPVHLLSPLVASTYLLVGMSKIEFGDHQRFTLAWSVSAALVMLVSAIVFGVIPFMGRA